MKSYLVNESKAMKSISKQVEKLYKSNQILILGESENSDTGSEILRHIIELKKKDNLKILSRFFDFKNQNFYSKEFSQSLSTFEIFVFKNINYLSNEDQMSLCDFILKSDHKQFILTCFDNNHYFIDKQLKVKEVESKMGWHEKFDCKKNQNTHPILIPVENETGTSLPPTINP